MKYNIYHFFVEGEGERAVINTLKTDFQCIQSGKVDVFNVIQNKLNKNILMKLKPGTIVILVFDTDKDETDINVNIKMYSFDHLRMYNINHINTCCSRW